VRGAGGEVVAVVSARGSVHKQGDIGEEVCAAAVRVQSEGVLCRMHAP
jgi:hypothetical protein